jgi:hypothetical protein
MVSFQLALAGAAATATSRMGADNHQQIET